jgi:signal transduction histidine kinase/ActR/RegA family two-component response regulator
VLVLAPTAKDAAITKALFDKAGLELSLCRSVGDLAEGIKIGAGAAIITEEALLSGDFRLVREALADQPAWSDFPLIVLVKQFLPPVASRVLDSLTNVMLLERPSPMRSLLSAVRAAVRGRLRQYELQAALERESAARSEAERANRLKDDFLATLSHELRTPLNSILGWANVLQNNQARPEVDLKRGLDAIARNARAQAELIEDLLDMGRILSGKLRLDVRTVDPAKITETAIETVRPAAEARDIRIEQILDPGAGPIKADPNRLQQVVWNLLTNAIKFTPRGGKVQIVLERVNSHIEMSVADTGEGIHPDFLPRIFERFSQADPSSSRPHPGLGLGLAIVKNLVEMHGGSVSAFSPGEGKGATFTLRLPLVVAREDEGAGPREHPRKGEGAAVACDVSLEGIKVLVVDDDPDALEVMSRVLQGCGASLLTASSAPAALEIMRRDKVDLVISDIGMPHQDGYWLISQIRSLPPEAGGRVPAAALTAFARSEDRKRVLLAGYQTHIPKPVESSELIAVIASLSGRLPGRGKER